MSVRCTECNYENDLQHTFCGMCGAKLPPPPPMPGKPLEGIRPETKRIISGPSLLGLESDPRERERVSYLLHEVDEDKKTSHGGRNAFLMALIVGLGLAAWYWRQDLRALVSQPGQSVTASDGSTPSAPAPQAPDAQQTQQQPAQASSTPQPVTPQPNPPASQPTAQASSAPTQPASDASDRAQTLASAPPTAQPDIPPAAKPDQPAKRASAADVTSLEAEGEKYLYGNGVTADCTRAQENLMAAAKRSSGKAQSVLGTMYATGHCVNRDLPVAYRWFSKALRQDPGNNRLEGDLKVLWRQMTPEEQNLALKEE